MKRLGKVLLVMSMCIGLVGCTSKENYKANIEVNTSEGKIKGALINEEKTISWIGVPYAKSPTGELRWKAPQEALKHEETLETITQKGPAPQYGTAGHSGEEDCLYVNVYRPNTDESNLPIMVFLHGGGNKTGTSADLTGESLAINGNMVVVSVDYRLGALGWLNLPCLKTGDKNEDSGNFGLLDIQKALQWVEKNANNFGGNPKNITLSGQSAGGRDVAASLISPIMEGLFDKVIIFSGGMTTSTMQEGQDKANEQLAKLRVKKGLNDSQTDAYQWMTSSSNEEVKKFLDSLSLEEINTIYDDPAIRMGDFPHLFTDGTTIPNEGFEVISSGKYNKVPVMLGSCASEFSMFALTDKTLAGTFFGGDLSKDERISEIAKLSKEYGSDLYASFNAERIAEVLIENKDQPDVYAYRFAWGESADISGDYFSSYVGATHGMDMDFVNGRFTSFLTQIIPGVYTENNLEGRQLLSLHLQQYIGNFVSNGNPNGENLTQWSTWASDDKLMVLQASNDKDTSAMSKEYIKAEEVWKALQDNASDEMFDIVANDILKGRFFDQR